MSENQDWKLCGFGTPGTCMKKRKRYECEVRPGISEKYAGSGMGEARSVNAGNNDVGSV